ARIGQSVTVLDHQTIEKAQVVVITDLLVRTPGVSFSRNGGVGEATSLRIRGAESDQTVVVIDGVKLNDPSQAGGGYNFGNLLTGDISRIEVLRGAQSTLWGSQAIGGVVNIVTTEPARPLEASLDAEGGSMSTHSVRAGIGGAGQRLTWRLAANDYSTSGVSAYRYGRESDGYANTGASGRANLKLIDGVSLDLRAVYSRGRNPFDGYPAPAYVFADDAEYGLTKDLLAYGGINIDLFGGRLRNRIAYDYTRTDRQNYDPAQAVTTKTFDARGETRRVEYQGAADLIGNWGAIFGAEHEEASMRAASPSPYDPNPAPQGGSTRTDSVYLQAQGGLAPGLTLTAGLRHDDHSTFGGKTLGQVAAAWSLNRGATVLRASLGQGFKAPTLYQLYSPYGNLTLKPEQANSWDAGVEQALFGGAVRASATYFGRRTTNQIDFFTCTGGADPLCGSGASARYGYYANTARTKAQGVELAASSRIGALALSGNYTWTDARNDVSGSANDGKRLARRPEHQANLSADWIWPVKLSTGLAVRYVGDSFDDAANRTLIKAYALVDLRAAYPIRKGFEVYGRIENLVDQHYETTHDYGSPGRAAYLGLRLRY
ncbi:MAG: TonB-dependent receptor, partial [Caulobacteraceae bacterium]|nr:TonB-dependent receptor [Caulobacteraceae bacterium]